MPAAHATLPPRRDLQHLDNPVNAIVAALQPAVKQIVWEVWLGVAGCAGWGVEKWGQGAGRWLHAVAPVVTHPSVLTRLVLSCGSHQVLHETGDAPTGLTPAGTADHTPLELSPRRTLTSTLSVVDAAHAVVAAHEAALAAAAAGLAPGGPAAAAAAPGGAAYNLDDEEAQVLGSQPLAMQQSDSMTDIVRKMAQPLLVRPCGWPGGSLAARGLLLAAAALPATRMALAARRAAPDRLHGPPPAAVCSQMLDAKLAEAAQVRLRLLGQARLPPWLGGAPCRAGGCVWAALVGSPPVIPQAKCQRPPASSPLTARPAPPLPARCCFCFQAGRPHLPGQPHPQLLQFTERGGVPGDLGGGLSWHR